MSFISHADKVKNKEIELNQRCSHLRSCALLYAQLRKVKRSTVIDEVASRTGVNILRNDLTATEIENSLNFILNDRMNFLEEENV